MTNGRNMVEDIYPLSPMQQGMLFHSLYSPESGLYHEQISCTLRGELKAAAFKQAWQLVVDNHTALRTAFVSERRDEPFQVVYKKVALPWQEQDCRGLAPLQQQALLDSFLDADRRRGFQLSKPPLMRFALIRTADDARRFIWSHHHLLLDGWSLPLIMNEVLNYYAALAGGRRPELESSRPYSDYIAWLTQQDLSRAERYWRAALKGFESPTPLSFGQKHDSPADQAQQYCQQRVELSQTTGLVAFARRHSLTMSTIVQGAWAILLSRHSGEKDVVFGTVVAGRPTELTGSESMIGLFINTLPVRARIESETPVVSWLKQLQSEQIEMRQYEFSPLVQVQGWSDAPRGLPLFESILVFENYPMKATLEGAERNLLLDDFSFSVSTNYPITLEVTPGPRTTLEMKYDSRRFEPAAISEMLSQLQTLLDQIVSEPGIRIESCSLVTRESAGVLPDPTEILPEPPYELTTDMIETWVRHIPEHTAVCQGGRNWSYGDLSESAHAIARSLITRGLEGGDTVAVLGDRSLGLIAGMTAALLSGGVLLTLDRNLPANRLRMMIEQSHGKWLVSAGDLQEDDEWVRDFSSLTVIVVDPKEGRCSDARSGNDGEQVSLPKLSADEAAYIFFTSGTTGQPKGILGSHKGLSHFLTWQREEFQVGPADRCAQLTGLSFDVVLRDIFLPLTSGATLCLPEPDDEEGPESVLRWLERERISLLHAVPSLAQTWLAGAPKEISLPALRLVFFAGEALTDGLVGQWREKFTRAGKLVNLYGPTETTLAKCFYRVPQDTLPGNQALGSPLPQTQALILSDGQRLCGIGEVGEIAIRTPFRSLGYINADEEGRRRFVKNPFREDERDLIYRTGDAGRYRGDGLIESLGRLDDQVKIRGVRIEPAEVNSSLSKHPAVNSSVVVARRDEQGQHSLVAYLVLSDREQADSGELRSYLSRHLPPAMIPSAFVFMDRLPLTANGKVDRRALPPPDGPGLERTLVEPRTPVEEVVAGIWTELLKREQLSVDDNFFELGGHSLLATQVLSRLRKVFKVEIGLRALFETATVASLAEKIEASMKAGEEMEAPPLVPVERADHLPLSFAQQRLWFLDQLEPGSSAYNIPTSLRIKGALDVEALQRSVNEVVRRHEILRTSFATIDGKPVQVIAPPSEAIIPVIELETGSQDERDEKVLLHLNEEACQPFDIAQSPLFRIILLRLASHDHVLLATMHHIIFDGWSAGILIRELTLFYEAFSKGQTLSLPELPLQYADFAIWQRQWLQGRTLEGQISYWREKIGGMPAVLELPADRPRPAVQSFRGARQSLGLSKALTDELKALSRRENATLFMTLLSAFKVLLYRYTSEEDICVGTPIANRNRIEIEGLMGFFTNTLVLRTDLSGEPSFRELLTRVRETALGAHAHQDLPFEKLVEELQPQRDLSRNPLFQVMFVQQNAPAETLALTGLSLSYVTLDNDRARFDLTLVIQETGTGLIAVIDYNSDLFDAETIKQMLQHYQTLLEAVCHEAGCRISDLPLMGTGEMKQIGEDWNQTGRDFEPAESLADLFEQQVRRTPGAVAVKYEEEQITYEELNRRANRLARYLKRRGVRAESRVGICLDRSIEMIVSLIAVVKTGGAYVPLDVSHPTDRIDYMLEEAEVELVISRRGEWKREEKGRDGEVIFVDEDDEQIAAERGDDLDEETRGDNLAYVIFTSGSTGRPKAVMISNKSICNTLLWRQSKFSLTETDNVLQNISLSFDPSVWQIFTPLLSGARLTLPRRGDHQDSAYLVRLISKEEISIVDFPPSMLRVFLQEPGLENCTALKHVFCGGEILSVELQDQFFARLSANLHNQYGPTEASIDATSWTCQRSRPNETVPIGRPIANKQIYVLDGHLQLLPVGVPGEIYIGGLGLARGYQKQPDLTAAQFIPNPFSDQPGARLYKTGDLASYLPDGSIKFIGRVDNQVKVRGYRVELGEIKTLLAGHSLVKEAEVVAREDAPGEKRLVAYLVLHANPSGVINILRGYLGQQLPDYMIPSAYVALASLPRMLNGKVDRAALPQPRRSDSGIEREFVAPRTPVEEVLAAIWAEVLKVDQVGVHDNFFELGGHSLLVTQVVSRLRDTFSLDLSPRQLFTSPTIATLAETMDELLIEKIEGLSEAEVSRLA